MKLQIIKEVVGLILLCSLFCTAQSQQMSVGNSYTGVEVGLNIGPAFLLGDLGGHNGVGTKFVKDVNMPLTKMMTGIFITVHPNEWLGLRLAGQYTAIEGKDNIIQDEGGWEVYRKQRDQDVRSDIWEMYLATEIFPMMWLRKYDEDYKPALLPYLLAGVGLFHFNPQGSLTDQNGHTTWYDLKPLRTEGQGMAEYADRKEYELTQINIPLGAGLKYFISPRINISAELLYRKTFTDYIDDVSTNYIDPNNFDKYLSPDNALIARKINDKRSWMQDRPDASGEGQQRGNPRNYDDYFSFSFRFGIRLGRIYENAASKYAWQMTKCPARF